MIIKELEELTKLSEREQELQDENRYRFKTLNKRKIWEAWTGSFITLLEAIGWYDIYGKIHEDRGHILGLFYKGEPMLTGIFEDE